MKIIVSVTNDLITDQRVARSCEVLHDLGIDVLLVGRKFRKSEKISRNYETKRMRLLFNRSALFYAEYNIRLFFFLLFHKADVLYANDLDVLLPNILVSKIKRIPVVYDSHEYFCGMPELVGRNLVRNTWKKIERYCIPRVSDMMTVNKSIADMYEKEYNINVEVLRNVSIGSNYKAELKKSEFIENIGAPYIIYQGAVNIQRGIEETIAAMEYIDGYKFVIAGDGDILSDLKQNISNLAWKNKIVILGRLSPDKLRHYTANASLGISPELDSCVNYKYCLPNKLFDYINAHIPVLVSDLVEMANIVTTYKVGEIIVSHEPKKLAEQILKILNNKEIYTEYQQNTITASKELCWEEESKKLVKIISSYINKNK